MNKTLKDFIREEYPEEFDIPLRVSNGISIVYDEARSWNLTSGSIELDYSYIGREVLNSPEFKAQIEELKLLIEIQQKQIDELLWRKK